VNSSAHAVVEEPVGGGAGRRRRAQDLHSRSIDRWINLSLSLCYRVSSFLPYTAAAARDCQIPSNGVSLAPKQHLRILENDRISKKIS
jgi:hypothetical protein